MKTALVAIGLLVLIGSFVYGAPLSGSWTFSVRMDLQTFSMTPESDIEINYSLGGWTFSSTALADLAGLDSVFFDAKGTLGGFALRSLVDFDASSAQFRAGVASIATAIGGVNLYALSMLDNVGTTQTPSMGSGYTLGGWAQVGDLSFWGQMRFNMTDTSSYIYKYGYDWLLDHFIFKVCDTWLLPSSYIDVQTSGCTADWTGADIYVKVPFDCFDLLTELSVSCAGFEHALFELSDIELGLSWLDIKWVDVMFTTTSKSVNTVFDVSVGNTACITPYFALEGLGTNITGLSLKALKLSYTWDNLTFKAGELFDEDGWYPYLNYTGTRYYGWTWDGELATLPACTVTEGYDEYLGLEMSGDSCCGGASTLSAFAWFDTGNSTGLFDWAETRVKLSAGIGSNVTLTFGMSIPQTGTSWFRLGIEVYW
ncbi:hypothetical protein J7J55_06255 [Candidatus Bipolaricaulota bacterium]|nr:hypothetical protein [Candidatus Bipolaricaulota bacterium]